VSLNKGLYALGVELIPLNSLFTPSLLMERSLSILKESSDLLRMLDLANSLGLTSMFLDGENFEGRSLSTLEFSIILESL